MKSYFPWTHEQLPELGLDVEGPQLGNDEEVGVLRSALADTDDLAWRTVERASAVEGGSERRAAATVARSSISLKTYRCQFLLGMRPW